MQLIRLFMHTHCDGIRCEDALTQRIRCHRDDTVLVVCVPARTLLSMFDYIFLCVTRTKHIFVMALIATYKNSKSRNWFASFFSFISQTALFACVYSVLRLHLSFVPGLDVYSVRIRTMKF